MSSEKEAKKFIKIFKLKKSNCNGCKGIDDRINYIFGLDKKHSEGDILATHCQAPKELMEMFSNEREALAQLKKETKSNNENIARHFIFALDRNKFDQNSPKAKELAEKELKDTCQKYVNQGFMVWGAIHKTLDKNGAPQPHLHLIVSERHFEPCEKRLTRDRYYDPISKKNCSKKTRGAIKIRGESEHCVFGRTKKRIWNDYKFWELLPEMFPSMSWNYSLSKELWKEQEEKEQENEEEEEEELER